MKLYAFFISYITFFPPLTTRYKKHSLAKALSNKTDAELRSVLGVSHSPKTVADSIYKGSGGKKGREGDAAPAVDGHKKEKKKKRRVDEEI